MFILLKTIFIYYFFFVIGGWVFSTQADGHGAGEPDDPALQ
jgi:hypothetical protein